MPIKACSGATLTQSVVQIWRYRQQDGWANRLAHLTGGRLENGIYGHSRFCNTDFDDKWACLNLSGV